MIDLTDARQQVSAPRLIDFGSELTPFLGGVTQRLDRIGSRHMIEVNMPPMAVEPDGRRWIAKLLRAKQEGGRVEFPQVEFEVGACGAPTVGTATTGGRSLPIAGGTPNYAVREGQWLTVFSGGRGYTFCTVAPVVLNASGAGTLVLDVPLRVAAAVADKVELAKPTIEGWIEGQDWSWTLEMARTVGLSFAIRERA